MNEREGQAMVGLSDWMADTRPMLYIFDKDQTLCPGVGDPTKRKTHAPNRLEDQTYFPDVEPKCKALIRAGHTLAVASNQGGVAFGIFSPEMAEALVKAAADHIWAKTYRVCFYHPNGSLSPYNTDSYHRKPNPGMLQTIMAELDFSPFRTVMVGDWDTDKQAADAAGCHFQWAHVFFGRVDPFKDRMHEALQF